MQDSRCNTVISSSSNAQVASGATQRCYYRFYQAVPEQLRPTSATLLVLHYWCSLSPLPPPYTLPPPSPPSQFIQLAGLTGTCATSSLRASSSGRDASLPGPSARPPGPIALLGPRQGNLWLVNALGQPLILPLSHPGKQTGRQTGISLAPTGPA